MDSYGSLSYARTQLHIGDPLWLERSAGVVLKRRIGDGAHHDLVGPYPWAGFDDWSTLGADLDAFVDAGLASATFVIAPTSNYSTGDLETSFPDYLVDFKPHHLVDLTTDFSAAYSRSHRRKIRGIGSDVECAHLSDPVAEADAWVGLYRQLVERHRIVGPANFPESALRRHLESDGMETFIARVGGRPVGMVLFIRSGATAAYHLGAYGPAGYRHNVAWGLFPLAFEYLRNAGIDLVNLGGAAGVTTDGMDGLSQFKRGWSSRSKMARIGGRILDRALFDELTGELSPGGFWPPYRSAERTP